MIKKPYFLLLLFLLMALMTPQKIFCQSKFGINAGINYSCLYAEKNREFNAIEFDRWEPKIGFRVGVNLEHSIAKRFGIYTELNYSLAGAHDKIDDGIVNLHYLSLPIAFFVKPLPNFKIQAGPEINFLIKQEDNISSYLDDKFEQLDYGIHAGLEYAINERWGISFRNYFGFQYNYTWHDEQLLGMKVKVHRNNVMQFVLHYYF